MISLVRFAIVSVAAAGLCLAVQAAAPDSPMAILQQLRQFREMGTVLYVAAHPDDENTQLLTYFARGRGYRTAYLSVTRGDGGQNVLGPEFGDELGVIRTQELLAARRLDGAHQFFTRAVDFGFSKSAQETLRIWDRQQVLSDVVRVIRTFEPDVIITRFSPIPGGTHGHHTSSAILALEAFKLAGDANAFPEQLTQLKPWQPKRILWNGFNRGAESKESSPVLHVDIDGQDPVLGESFSEIAARSRAMHKTQGFDNFRGFGRGGGAHIESFQLLAGDPATHDVLDGVDTTWKRVPGGEAIEQRLDTVMAQFDTNHPAASLPALLELRAQLAPLPKTPLLNEKRDQLDLIVRHCLGLSVQTVTDTPRVAPGESFSVQYVVQQTAHFPVRWAGVRSPLLGSDLKVGLDLKPGQRVEKRQTFVLPPGTPLSQPYWLQQDHPIGMFRVADSSLIGRPENPPAFPVEQVFELGDQTLVVSQQPVDAGKSAHPETLEVIAPVSLSFATENSLFAPGSTHAVEVKVTAARPATDGTLHLDTPEGWRVSPSESPFHIARANESVAFTFQITAPARPQVADFTAHALVGGRDFACRRVEICYPHIPSQLLQPPARLKAISLDLVTVGHRVGYLPGAGDSVSECVQEMGYHLSTLTGADLTPEKLKGLDAVVIGVRALNVRSDLTNGLAGLFQYVEGGGTVIVQYNRPNGVKTESIAPYRLHLSNERVTDETAPVTFLQPENPVLNVPNKITEADFNGWVQERGLYFPDTWDDHFQPVIACSDPGEAPLKGSLLVAPYGKGYFVYTGLAWFRQLPAGVPGAYRLFANLLALGKPAAQRADGGGP